MDVVDLMSIGLIQLVSCVLGSVIEILPSSRKARARLYTIQSSRDCNSSR